MCIEMSDFPFLRLSFECRVTGPLLYFTSRRGETIKGLIAQEMKKLFPCRFEDRCERCRLVDTPENCDYVRFFRFDICKMPFSYVIVPPLNPRSVYCHNETFQFEIRLFGQCAQFEYLIHYLAPAIEQGGLLSGIGTWYKDKEEHFGRFQLSGIHVWQGNAWLKVFQEQQGFVGCDNITGQSFRKHFGSVGRNYNRICFYTPFCLKKAKVLVPIPTFGDILYFSIMRLRTVCGDRTIKVSDEIYEKAGSVETMSADVEMVHTEKNVSYSMGSLAFDGAIPGELVSILLVGGLCHIGKGTSQGYGGYFLIC